MEPWLVITIAVVGVAAVARWLFRQRTPDEIRAARERLRRFRGKRLPRSDCSLTMRSTGPYRHGFASASRARLTNFARPGAVVAGVGAQ